MCGKSKNIKEFYWDKKRNIPFAKCIDCQLKRQRELYKANKDRNSSRFKDFNGIGKFTDKEMCVISLMIPGPLGRGMNIVKAAKELGISHITAAQRVARFKKNNPIAWEKIDSMLRAMYREGRSMISPNQILRDGDGKIIDRFVSRKWSDNNHDNNPKNI